MANKVVASLVKICIFWRDSLDYDNIQNWPIEVRTAWDAFAEVIVSLRARHGNAVPVELYVCPTTISENAAIVSANGLSMSVLPAAQVFAEYPNGEGSNFFLMKDLHDRATGLNWTAADVRPYVEALLYRSKPAEKALLCQLVPPLCSVGGWAWLAMASVATLKAASTNSKAGQAVWGVGSALLWQAWYKRGGLEQIKQLVSK